MTIDLERSILIRAGKKKAGNVILEHGPGDDGVSIVGASILSDRGLLQEHRNGSFISSFPTSDYDPASGGISGISRDSDGNFWVCDINNAKIYNINKDGSFISSFDSSDYDVAATAPNGIAVDPDGSLWVCDFNSDKIYNISKTGTLKSSFETSVYDAASTGPSGITVDTDNKLWITDSNSDKVYNVQRNGTLISSFATSTYDAASTEPRGIEIDIDGSLWICDATSDKIYNVSKLGALISLFATSVYESSASVDPTGITIDYSDDNIESFYICDSNRDKVYNLYKTGIITRKIVYFNQQTGSDAGGDGSELNPYLTLSKAESDINTITITHTEKQDELDLDVLQTRYPCQASLGKQPKLINTGNDFDWTDQDGAVTDNLKSIAYGYGNYVAVGAGAEIQKSTNCVKWEEITHGITLSNLNYVAFGNKIFIAVGNTGKIIKSNDFGNTWTEKTSAVGFGTTNCNAIAYGSTIDTWVIIGDNGEVQYSTDSGETWNDTTLSGFGTDNATAISFGIGVLSGIGQFIIGGQNGKINVSPNGINWSLQLGAAGFGTTQIESISFNYDTTNGTFAAVGGTGKIQTRPWNSTTWTDRTSATATILNSITYGHGFFMIGGANKTQVSPDGITWTLKSDTNNNLGIYHNVAFGENTWISSGAVGYTETSQIGLAVLDDLLGFKIENANELLTKGIIKNCDIDINDVYNFNRTNLINSKGSDIDFIGEFFNVQFDIIQSEYLLSSLEAISDAIVCFDKFRIENGSDVVLISSNKFKLLNSLIKASAENFNSVILNGYSENEGDINIEQNTIIGDLDINNSGGTDLGTWQDNIIEGSIDAESEITIQSGNIRGNINSFIILSSKVTSLDPLFVDGIDYKLQREANGYAFDSPLVAASVFHITSKGQSRDLGAWNYDDSEVKTAWRWSEYFPKPKEKGQLKIIKSNIANLQISISGAPDSFIDPERATEKLIMNFGTLPKKYIDFIDLIESQKNMSVLISLYPKYITSFPDNVIVNGAHSIGDPVLNVTTSGEIKGGYIFELSNKKYYVLYPVPLNGPTEKIVLSEPLEVDLSGGENIIFKSSTDLSEWFYIVPPQRALNPSLVFSDERQAGLVLEFIRQLNV